MNQQPKNKQLSKTIVHLNWVRTKQCSDMLALRVLVNGLPFEFIVDTAAARSVIDENLFQQHFNNTQDDIITVEISGATSIKESICFPATISVVDFELTNEMIVLPVKELLHIDGLLGMDYLQYYNAQIDIKNLLLTLYAPQL